MKGFKDESTNKKKGLLKNKIITEAFYLHSSGNLIEAGKKYKYFLDQGFTDPRVFSNYAIILKENSRINEAIELLNESIKRYPSSSDSYSVLSDILRNQGKLNESRISLEKAVSLNPNEQNYHFNLGII